MCFDILIYIHASICFIFSLNIWLHDCRFFTSVCLWIGYFHKCLFMYVSCIFYLLKLLSTVNLKKDRTINKLSFVYRGIYYVAYSNNIWIMLRNRNIFMMRDQTWFSIEEQVIIEEKSGLDLIIELSCNEIGYHL